MRLNRSAFESIFPDMIVDSVTPSPKLALFDRIHSAFSDADERLAKNINSRKSDRSLLPRCKPL